MEALRILGDEHQSLAAILHAVRYMLKEVGAVGFFIIGSLVYFAVVQMAGKEATLTSSLIVGAIAERMKFSAILLFVALWMFVVYFPLAHMVWSPDVQKQAEDLMVEFWKSDMPAEVPWALGDSGDLTGLIEAFAVNEPEHGLLFEIPVALWPAFYFTDLSGNVVPGALTPAEIEGGGFNALGEPLQAILEDVVRGAAAQRVRRLEDPAALGLGQVQQRKAVHTPQAFEHPLDAVPVGVGLDHAPDAGIGHGGPHAGQVVTQGVGVDGGKDGARHGRNCVTGAVI